MDKIEYPRRLVEKIVKVNGEIAHKNYVIGKFLGKGGFARCFEAICQQNGKKLAVKIVLKESISKNRSKNKLISQIKIHKSMHHKNVVQLDHVYEDQIFVYIFLELCQHRALTQLIKKRKFLSEKQAKYFMFQIFDGIMYLHQHNVIHRDIKPGNIFLAKGLICKVGDFGLASKLQFQDQRKRTVCGTPNYIAPEVIQGAEGHSFDADVWSWGIIIYIMLFGKPPFESPNDISRTYKNIRKCKYKIPEKPTVSNQIKDFISKLFVPKPIQRLSREQILEHPVFQNKNQYPSFVTSQMYFKIISFNKQIQINLINKNKVEKTNNLQKHKSALKIDLKKIQQAKELKTIGAGGYLTARSPRALSTDRFFKKQQRQNINLNEVCIYKYLDFEKKYGLGFMLTNGNSGVFFNDNTILIQQSQKYIYIVRKQQSQKISIIDKEDYKDTQTIQQKKKKLLLHFQKHLESQKHPKNKKITQFNSKNIYPKQWIRTKQALLIRLSNKVVQVFFQQGDELVIESSKGKARYWKKEQYQQKQLGQVQDFSDLQVRISYTRRLLNQLVNQQ